MPYHLFKDVDSFENVGNALSVSCEHTVKELIANCSGIMVGTYKLPSVNPGREYLAISAVQCGDPIVHMNLCLGNVAMLAMCGHIRMLHLPAADCEWDMCLLPFLDVELGIRIMVDTVLRGKYVEYNCHMLENIEHMLGLWFLQDHANPDSCKGDVDYDEPETWTRGVQCSQLTLLVLKRCIHHKALSVTDTNLENEFMHVYSPTCTPGALYRLIDKVWPESKHKTVRYNRFELLKDIDWTPTKDLGSFIQEHKSDAKNVQRP